MIPPEILAAFPRGPWRSEVHPYEPNVTRIVQAAPRGTWVARILHNGEQMPVVQEALSQVFAAVPALFAHRQRIETDDIEAARIGARVADVLGLRKRADKRYMTAWGARTDAGLARTVLTLLTGEQCRHCALMITESKGVWWDRENESQCPGGKQSHEPSLRACVYDPNGEMNVKKCFELTNLAFPITLHQHGADSFRVTYGKEVKDRLTYGAAAAALGAAIMHALACDDKLNNAEASERHG